MNLSEYQWKKRPVLIFTPTTEDASYERQLEIFKTRKPELDERDIVVIPIVGTAENRIRSQFRVGNSEFCVILIGKDGAEKHRWVTVAPVEQIAHRVDRMPMRRVEMKGK